MKFAARCVAVIALLGCQERHPFVTGHVSDAGASAQADGGAPSPSGDLDGGVPSWPDAGPTAPDAPCTRATCTTVAGNYCGKIGDGCGGTLDCGGCPSGQVCGSVSPGICGGAADCQPLTCTTAAGHYCGWIGDGCGRLLDCGDCASGEVCGNHVCSPVVAPDCKPLTCATATGQYCGKIGDGCGGTLQCGDCSSGQSCGSGVTGVCGGAADCKPITCDTAGGRYCGKIGDGCGRVLDCGDCAAGLVCGAGAPNVCGGGASCQAITCVTATGRYCGKIGDGCGGSLDCGDCTGGQTCGAGIHNVCGGGAGCTAITCLSANGRYCGKIGDGCGGALDCGDCPTGSCGGDGVDHVCSGSKPPVVPGCKPATCDAGNGRYCGLIGDGCGGSLDCGACPTGTCGGGGTAHVCGVGVPPGCKAGSCTVGSTSYCGAIGDGCGQTLACGDCPTGQSCGVVTANVCGVPGCVPTSCTQPTGKYCGSIGDGCGRNIDCGGCTGGDTCGGGGTPGVCGHDPCVNLCKRQQTCSGGQKTTLTGTVFAPTPPKFGSPDPIYNAIVYIPNAPVAAFTTGVSCDRCGTNVSGSPLVQARTGADGKFTLENVPTGDNVPLVIQLGRWRRQVVIPHIDPCVNTPLGAELTRLPRNKSEGDIPLMAMDTGKVDALECVLRKIGIDEAEFTLPSATGRVRMYKANGATVGAGTPAASTLYGSAAALDKYDMVLLACEGSRIEKATADKQRLIDYANAGGRVFATHFSYTWLYNISPFSGTATWKPDQKDVGNTLTGVIDQSFAKGSAFAQWLQIVGASPTPGQIQIAQPRHDVNAVVPPSQRWVYSSMPTTVQHYTFNTPVGVGADQQCGRVLFSDFHVTDATSTTDVVFPKECANTPLTAQEKVLEFMIFDLSSCVESDTTPTPPPMPPPPPPGPPPAAPPPPPPAAPPPAPPPPPPAPSTPPPSPPTAPPPPPPAPPGPPTPPPAAPPPPPPPPPPAPPPIIQ